MDRPSRAQDDRSAHGREQVETVIVGAGQTGLAVGQRLAERDRSLLILEANDRLGDNWRRHYDSLHLYNPARLCSLPGLPFPGPDDRFPTRDEAAAYLEDYAATFDLPVRTGTRVDEVRPDGDGYVVATGDREIKADNVVVAFQYSFSSMLFVGVGQDARHVADHIIEQRVAHRTAAAA